VIDDFGPVVSRTAEKVVEVGRSPWLPVGVLVAAILYLLGQRRIDGGGRLSHAGRPGDPDDELIDL
jgi:hypothetical protein